MANNLWRGDAPAVAQINTVTPANVGIGNTFTVTINGKSITVTATAGTVANVTALLAAAIAASTIAEFAEVTATDNTTNVLLTASTPGVPFTQTSTASGGTATNTTATPTASAGPNDINVAANWTDGVPNAADDVYISGDVSLLYNLSTLAAVTLTSLNIQADFTGTIGLPLVNESGGYYEYRATRLTVMATTVNVGKGLGSGSGRIRLDLGNNTTTINVLNTGSAIDPFGALDIKGHATPTYTVIASKGSIAFAAEPADVAKIALTCEYLTNQAGDVSIYAGAGCTLSTITQTGGSIVSHSSVTITTWFMLGGTANHLGTGAITTLTINGGTYTDQSTGTITGLTVNQGGTYDRTQDRRSKIVTQATIYSGATLLDPHEAVALFTLNNCTLADVTLDIGTGVEFSRL